MNPHSARRERLARCLGDESLDALLITSTHNVTYLTGFSGDSSALVVTPHRVLLISDPRYIGQIADECPDLETHIRSPKIKLQHAMAQVLHGLGVKKVGCESAALTLADAEMLREVAPSLDWKPAADRVERLRMVKDAVEIEAIREAIRIAESAFLAFRGLLRPDDREKELADRLETLVRHLGGQGCAFTPIVGVGDRAALPHCPPTMRQVHESNLLLVDWGATGPTGYRSDLTRVLPTHKKHNSIDEKLRRIHAVVLEAQKAALALVRPGAIGKDIDAAARNVIAQAGHGEHFGHGLGHGIGLQIHEAPAVRPLSETRLEPGMVFTLEPGIYIPEWGGVRIEDDVLVTPDGVEVLTSVPRDLESLQAFC